MTLVGKIFTVLILIMSVAFMMLAVTVFATHRNWRDMVLRPETPDAPAGLKLQIEQSSDEIKRLNVEKKRAGDRLATEQAARRFALAALQSRYEQASQELQQRERAYAELQASHGEAVETLNTNQMNLEALTTEVRGLRDEIRNVQQSRDEQFLAVVKVTDRMNEVEGERQKLQERQIQLLDKVSRMQVVLERNELTEYSPINDIPPEVNGVVTAVGQTDLIEISIGSDDGLRKGHALEVYRNNSYLGRIIVQHTEPDSAVGRILREYRKGIIRKGDRVATKLS
jgi:hypothetical protein